MAGMYEVICWTCEGSGQRAQPTAIVLGGAGSSVIAARRCPECSGRGYRSVATEESANPRR